MRCCIGWCCLRWCCNLYKMLSENPTIPPTTDIPITTQEIPPSTSEYWDIFHGSKFHNPGICWIMIYFLDIPGFFIFENVELVGIPINPGILTESRYSSLNSYWVGFFFVGLFISPSSHLQSRLNSVSFQPKKQQQNCGWWPESRGWNVFQCHNN